MTTNVNIRELVLDILIEVNEKDEYSHLMIRGVLDKHQYLEKKERAFLTRLAEGTIEHQIEMDYIINSFSKVKVRKMKPFIRNLLRMSVYQLRYMDAIPDSAVCNEAVKLAKKRGFRQLSGFVNGVLRSVVREGDRLLYPDAKLEPERYLEVCYSVPGWIVSGWLEAYGFSRTEEILKNFYREEPLTIRTNRMKGSPEQLCTRLKTEGVIVDNVGEKITDGVLSCKTDDPAYEKLFWEAWKRISGYAFSISGFDHLQGLSSFRDGDFYVQDVSSMLAAELAEPKKGDYIIDVCAAPGGKSSHMAELMDGTGMVEARDLTEYKTGLIEENQKRHELSNMKAVQMDATVRDPASVGKADILMCDLPCSGLGVMGKKTDIRYKMTPEKQKELVLLQRRILKNVIPYVKKGGTVIYSTCTIQKEENENNAIWITKEFPDMKLLAMKQMFPGELGNDGFFIAKLRRDNE